MQNILNKHIQQLTHLVEQSQNKKLLLEEMRLISEKAFALQEKIMEELDKTEASEQDIVKVQAAFTARESIWDLMSRITDREQELKEKTYHKETPEERAKRHREIMDDAEEEHRCCCGHHHEARHHDHSCCRKEKKKCKKN